MRICRISLFLSIAWSLWTAGNAAAQTPRAPKNGDVYQTRGSSQTVEQAFSRLYQAAAEITASPSSGYQQAHADQSDWPAVTAAQRGWQDAMAGPGGRSLTPRQSMNMVPCAAHLNNAIADMESGYRIHITQKSPLAERTVVNLYAKGRGEFAQCSSQAAATGKGPGTDPSVDKKPTRTPGEFPSSPQGIPGRPKNPPPTTFPEPWPTGEDVKGWTCYDTSNDPATGAAPPMRYMTGFTQGAARCMASQCSRTNLAAAVWSASFQRVRMILGAAALPVFLNAVVHPPGYSTSSDPYTRGREEGERLCNYSLQVGAASGPVRSRAPIVNGGKLSTPPGFNFREVANSIHDWIQNMNPDNGDRNCGMCTVNSVRAATGQPLRPAPATRRGMTTAEMERELGTRFGPVRSNANQMEDVLNRLPEGTVVVIDVENPSFNGTVPSGPATGWNSIPGHFYWGVKWNGSMQYWDGQTQGAAQGLPANWRYTWSIVGNPLAP